MENSQLLDDNTHEGMQVGPEAKTHLGTAAKWSFFLAILGFIFCGLGILGMLSSLMFSSGMSGLGGSGTMFISLFMLAILGVYFYVVLCLYRFADKAKSALASNNSDILTDSLENLGKYFKITGIITIVVIAFYMIAILFFGSMFTSLMGGGF